MPFQSWVNPWTRPKSDDGYSFSPLHLNPYAWYDAHIGGSAAGITDSSAFARPAMTVGAGSNSPLHLPYSYPVVTPVGSGSEIQHTSPSGIQGDVEVVIRQSNASTPWTTAGDYYLAGDRIPSGGWSFEKFTDGGVYFQFVSPGPTLNQVSPGFSVDSALLRNSPYVKLIGRPNVGAGNARFELHTSSDGVAWTLFNQSSSAVSGTTISPSSSPLFIGRNSVWSIASAAINNGVGGPAVATFDAALCGQTGYGPWTVIRPTSGRKTVVQSPAAGSAESLFLLGVDDWLDVPASAVPRMGLTDNATVVVVAREWATPGDYCRLFSAETVVNNGFIMQSRSGSPFSYLFMSDGTNVAQSNGPTRTLGSRSVTTQTVSGRSATGLRQQSNNSSPVTANNSAVGSLTNAAARVGAIASTAAAFVEAEFRALLTFDRALSASEIAQLVAYYGGDL